VIKIGIFTTDFNIHQIALWRLINSYEQYAVKIYIFTYDAEINQEKFALYEKMFLELKFQVIPSTKGKIRLPQGFLAAEKVEVAVLYDYWYHFERQLVKQADKFHYKVILHTMIERIIDLQKKSESFLSNLHLKWCFSNVDAFCLLGYTAQWRLSHLGVPAEKIFLVPNVIDASIVESQKKLCDRDQIREGLDIAKTEIVFLLYHDWMNDTQASSLMKAMSLLKNYPQIALIFIGEETKKQKIYDLLGKDFKGRLIVAGKCGIEKSGYYFCASDVFVMSASKYYWGDMSNFAMQWGLPTIINNACECGGEFVIDGYTGYSFYDNDDEALVRYMRKFITNPELIVRMSEAAERQVDNYTVQVSAEGFADAINFVLGK